VSIRIAPQIAVDQGGNADTRAILGEIKSFCSMMAKALNAHERPVIVLVDDDAAVLVSLKFALEMEGFSVLAYENAEDLLADTEHVDPGCFVLDYYLPGANGLDLLKSLRRKGLSTPVILITTNPSQSLVRRVKAEGATIVEKPLLGNGLLDAVRNLVGA
jgi:two-component system response regulator FixJ